VLSLIHLDEGQSFASGPSLLLLHSPSGNPLPLSGLWWSRSIDPLGLWILLIVVLLALAWVLSIRRVERRQTAVLHTLRKEEEKALRESEERFRHLAENMHDIVWIVSLDSGTTLFVNSAFEKITGRTCQSLYDRPNCLDLIHPEDRAQAVATLFKQVLEKYEGDAEFRIVLHAGASRWMRCRAFSILQNGRGANQVGCIAEDITERKRVMKALQEAETKYRAIFENSMEGIFRSTEDGRFLAANPALARIYGYDTPAELINSVTNIEQQVYVDPARGKEFLRLLRQGEGVAGFEAQQYRKDGSAIHVMATARAIRDSTGKLIYFEGAVQDITERKRAEELLRQVSGRLLRLQDEERRRIARELHDSTAQMLSALIMNLSAIQKSAARLGEKSRHTFAESLALAKQCSREVRTISYLLHPPLLEELGLVSALRHYVDGYTQRSGIRVELEVAPDFNRLPQDIELALFRVVQESLINIHRHSGSPTARVRVMRDSNAVMLEVMDEGRGMPPEILDRTKRIVPGLGVGIAGMQERLEQLGGMLETDSGSQGTTVRAILPHPDHS
jgi:PAS domain S-box-containing protein